MRRSGGGRFRRRDAAKRQLTRWLGDDLALRLQQEGYESCVECNENGNDCQGQHSPLPTHGPSLTASGQRFRASAMSQVDGWPGIVVGAEPQRERHLSQLPLVSPSSTLTCCVTPLTKLTSLNGFVNVSLARPFANIARNTTRCRSPRSRSPWESWRRSRT